jgi:3-dehydroquinate synthase
MTHFESLEVALGERSYPIHIGTGLLDQIGMLRPLLSKQVAVVTNDVVAPIYLERLLARLQAEGVQAVSIVLPDGEAHKDWASLQMIYDALLTHRCERNTTLLALGGGVVGDITGFASATYQRGTPFIQIPTTLLSQVDSSVGGKTAINHPLGKNMIGAFHQPRAVLIDTDTLNTLQPREYRAGLAEVIKHGVIRDAAYFDAIEQHLAAILARQSEALAWVVKRSCEIKAEVVAQDERESGLREILNFGHTFGHAIEAGFGYGVWLHGEAVATGMVMASDLSRRMGLLDGVQAERISKLLAASGLPVRAEGLGAARFMDLMRIDKKSREGRMRFILSHGIGRAEQGVEADPAALSQTLQALA